MNILDAYQPPPPPNSVKQRWGRELTLPKGNLSFVLVFNAWEWDESMKSK